LKIMKKMCSYSLFYPFPRSSDRFRQILSVLISSLFLTGLILCISCKTEPAGESASTSFNQTPLDSYVNAPDPSFHSEIMYQAKKEGYTLIVLKMISQEWLTTNEVDEPAWWHWVTVVVPDTIEHDTALMWVGGGDKEDALPQEAGPILTQSALLTHSVAAEIHNIPNQPITFVDDTIPGRTEDALIAFGWRKFLEGGAKDEDAIWLARLPMTKAVVRAMDAVEELIAGEYNQTIEHYVVSGASKRGWTTWTTAAVDDRVIAIVPVVIDLLNIVPSFEHHWRNYGFWAPAIHNYVEEGIMDWMNSEEFSRLLDITEPYSYIERLDMPKLLINAAGDQFFQPDSWQFYWDDLVGEKHLRYVPNTGHSLRDTDALESLVAFYLEVIENKNRPDYQWEIRDNQIYVEVDPENAPVSIRLWQAGNNETRDFRIDLVGEIWKDSILAVNPEGIYRIDLADPVKGWKAYFVELNYPGKVPLKVTTGISILPKIYPFDPFVSENPQGTQVIP
jgi:PhoPQ-activated pathogenicity-related protein